MRNIMKAATLESRFPLMAVEHGCIISKWKSHATLTPLAKQDGPLWLQYD